MTDEHATWVYAMVPGAAEPPPAVTGVSDEPVRLIPHGGVAAVVGSVDRAEVDEALAREPQDAAWLERAARRHHRVVTALFPRVPTVPFRLATLYHDDTRVRVMLAQRAAEFLVALDSVTDRTEWGVQAYAVAAEPVSVGASADRSRPGTEYLLRRRAERSAREQVRWAAGEAAHEVDARLRRLAVAVSSHPVTGDGMLLNGSYLVDDERADEFVRAVRKLAEHHPQVRLRTTGPWPAYSFVEVAQAAP